MQAGQKQRQKSSIVAADSECCCWMSYFYHAMPWKPVVSCISTFWKGREWATLTLTLTLWHNFWLFFLNRSVCHSRGRGKNWGSGINRWLQQRRQSIEEAQIVNFMNVHQTHGRDCWKNYTKMSFPPSSQRCYVCNRILTCIHVLKCIPVGSLSKHVKFGTDLSIPFSKNLSFY